MVSGSVPESIYRIGPDEKVNLFFPLLSRQHGNVQFDPDSYSLKRQTQEGKVREFEGQSYELTDNPRIVRRIVNGKRSARIKVGIWFFFDFLVANDNFVGAMAEFRQVGHGTGA